MPGVAAAERKPHTMTASVRLPLIAGTVVALTAGAVAVPAGHPDRLAQALASSTAQVSLTAWHNPIDQLLGTLEVLQNYGLGSYYNGGDAPTPGAGEANWPYAGMDQTGGDLLNYALYNQIGLGYNNFVGNIPNTVANANPILQRLQINLAGYANAGISGLIGAGAAISAGVWDYPAALLDAAQLALQGQVTQAVGVLVDAVVTPASAALQSLLTAGATIGGDIIARLGAVLAAVPEIVTKFVGWAIGGTALLAEKSAGIFTTWAGKLSNMDFEGAWNTAVDGLLGPSGLPGTAMNLSIGAGVQTGPITSAGDIATNFVPSLRTSVNSAVWSVQDAMTTSAPLPGAARAAAAVPAAEVPSPRAEVAAVQPGDTAASADAATQDAPASAGRATRKDGASSSARDAGHRGAKRAAAAAE